MKIGEEICLHNAQLESFFVEYLGKGKYLVKNKTFFVGGCKVMEGPLSKIRKWVMSCP